MMTGNQHKGLSSEFLAQHHDLLLYNAYHQIKAYLLYPPHCSCKESCQCEDLRTKAMLSLNVNLYNKARRQEDEVDRLPVMRFLLNIPDDRYLSEHYGTGYPTWLIEKELKEREEGKHFKIVNRLVWGILRLAETYKATIFKKSQASLREVIKILLGERPLKTKASNTEDYLGGEKVYFDSFTTYKPVCHFIAAWEFVKKDHSTSSLTMPHHIEAFLKTAHWLRKELLCIETPNTKMNIMFLEETLLPLPSWVSSDDIGISLEPFKERLEEIEALVREALKQHNM